MTLTLLEGAVDAVKGYLATNFDAKLNTAIVGINARYEDTLVVPQAYYIGEIPQSMPETPSLVIRGSAIKPGLQGATNIELDHYIDLVLFVGHNDLERRFRMISRYTVAILEMLRACEASIKYMVVVRGSIQYTTSIDEEPFLQAVIIPLTVEQKQTY